MSDKKFNAKMMGFLIVACLLIGVGIGLLVEVLAAKDIIGATSVIGLGVGFLAAFLYGVLNK